MPSAPVQPAAEVVLRRPAFPLSRLTSLAGTRAEVCARMRAWAAEPWVQDALFLASPAFAASVRQWVGSTSDDPALERALLRYLTRMSARATPFGLFAATVPASVTGDGAWVVAPRAELRRVSRLSAGLLSAQLARWRADPLVQAVVRWYPSPLLHRVRAGWRTYGVSADQQVQVAMLDRSPALEAAIERARGGATRRQLRRAIAARSPGASKAEVEAFLEGLMNNQVLRCELELPICSSHPLADVVARLPAASAARGEGERLLSLQAQLDVGPPPRPPGDYQALLDATAAPDAVSKPAVSVDLYEPDLAAVSRSMMRRVQSVAVLCRRLRKRPDDYLRAFHDAFVQTFDQAEARLVDVLEPSSRFGLNGFVTEDSEGAQLPLALGLLGVDAPPRSSAVLPMVEFLGPKVARALARGERQVTVSRAEAEAAARLQPAPTHPNIGTLFADLFSGPAGDRQMPHLKASSSRPLAALLARQAHGSPSLRALATRQLAVEAAHFPGTVPVDVLHLADPEQLHLVAHPSFGLATLSLQAEPTPVGADAIALDDVLVSVRDGAVVLRSQSRGVVLRPHTLNSLAGLGPKQLPFYRFLAMVSACASDQFEFEWGPFEQFEFLPRVVIDGVVISLARWRLTAADLPAATLTAPVRIEALGALRRRLDLPRLVRWLNASGTEALVLDLDNPLCLEELAAHLARAAPPLLLLEEVSPGDDLLPGAAGADGRYLVEMVAPVAVAEPALPATAVPPRPLTPRHRAPGSRWLYAKLYAAPAVADELLRGPLRRLVRRARAGGHLGQWFFIRYADPRWHLRLRLGARGQRFDPWLLTELERVCAASTRRGLDVRLELDTWDLELERYGQAAGHALTERWFEADSDAIFDLLARPDQKSSRARFELAMEGAVGLLATLGFGIDTRAALISRAASSMRKEKPHAGSFDELIGQHYRQVRSAAEAIALRAPHAGRSHPAAVARLAQRDRVLAGLAPGLRRLCRDPASGLSVEGWALDMIHLNVNRLMMSAPREHELVMYEFLSRAHRSALARSNG